MVTNSRTEGRAGRPPSGKSLPRRQNPAEDEGSLGTGESVPQGGNQHDRPGRLADQRINKMSLSFLALCHGKKPVFAGPDGSKRPGFEVVYLTGGTS